MNRPTRYALALLGAAALVGACSPTTEQPAADQTGAGTPATTSSPSPTSASPPSSTPTPTPEAPVATPLLARAVDAATLRAMTGHKTQAMTDHYDHPLIEDSLRALEPSRGAVEKALGGNQGEA